MRLICRLRRTASTWWFNRIGWGREGGFVGRLLLIPCVSTKQDSRSSLVSSVRFFGRPVVAKIKSLAVTFYDGTECPLVPAHVHTLKTGEIIWPQARISDVQTVVRVTQVDPSIVMRVTITVVKQIRRVLPSHHFPDDPMRLVLLPSDEDVDAPWSLGTGWLAFATKRMAYQIARLRVVGEQFEQRGLIRKRGSFHKKLLTNSGGL